MTLNEFVEDALNKEQDFLMEAVKDLTPEELTWRPGPDANPIGWILWHMLRVEDMWVQFFYRPRQKVVLFVQGVFDELVQRHACAP